MSKEILVRYTKPVGTTTIPIWMGKVIGETFWCFPKAQNSWALSKRGIDKMIGLLDGTGADAIFHLFIHETCGEEVEEIQSETLSLSQEILLLSLKSQLALAKVEYGILKENQRGASTTVYDTMFEVAKAKLSEINRQLLELEG